MIVQTIGACEAHLVDLTETKPANAEILRSACLSDMTTYNEAPRWYADGLKEEVIRATGPGALAACQ